jgi:hypothetical protein
LLCLYFRVLYHLFALGYIKVTPEERRDAEIDYLKRFGPDWVKSGGSQDINKSKPSEEFLKNHPRFQDILKSGHILF